MAHRRGHETTAVNISVSAALLGAGRPSRLDPSHPGVSVTQPGVAGVQPAGRCPQECPGPIAPNPGFPWGLQTPKMFTAVVMRPAPNKNRTEYA